MNAAKFDQTITSLKEVGVRVRVSHLRRFKVKEAGGLLSIGSFNSLPEQMISPRDIYALDERGGATLCQFYLEIEGLPEPQLIIEAMVTCHKKDHYNKRIGRTKALGRALHELALARAEGRLLLPLPAHTGPA